MLSGFFRADTSATAPPTGASMESLEAQLAKQARLLNVLEESLARLEARIGADSAGVGDTISLDSEVRSMRKELLALQQRPSLFGCGEWSSEHIYGVGSVVCYQGAAYYTEVVIPSGSVPPSASNRDWCMLAARGRQGCVGLGLNLTGKWDAERGYNPRDVVLAENGSSYYCLAPHVGRSPLALSSSSSAWALLAAGGRRGNTWTTGLEVPRDLPDDAVVGDMFLHTSTGDVYQARRAGHESVEWFVVVSLAVHASANALIQQLAASAPPPAQWDPETFRIRLGSHTIQASTSQSMHCIPFRSTKLHVPSAGVYVIEFTLEAADAGEIQCAIHADGIPLCTSHSVSGRQLRGDCRANIPAGAQIDLVLAFPSDHLSTLENIELRWTRV